MRNSTAKYTTPAKFFHWISAIIIIWATVTGFIVMLSNIDTALKLQIANLNVSITMLFIPLFIVRVLYRTVSHAPCHDDAMPTVEAKVATWMHMFLYLLVSVVLLTGVLMMDRPINIFQIIQFPQLVKMQNTIDIFKTVHKYATELLGICVCIHIGAVIKHEIKGIRILNRMI